MKPWHALTVVPVLGAALVFGAPAASAQQITWTTIVNNGDVMPGTADTLFNSYNQPSINAAGLVVFRARSRGAGGEGEDASTAQPAGNPTHGIYERRMSRRLGPITRIFDSTTLVPAPNNLDATFTEFPSFPRIGILTNMIATRGQSTPVWEYTLPDGTETRVGTSGIYMSNLSGAFTAMTLLGAVPGFSYWQVPGAPAGTKFDVFPGAPSPTRRVIAFKGNWTDASGVGQTGVYYRELDGTNGTQPVIRIADTSTLIPDDGTGTFGSTAPPSAAGGAMVFVGLDNEDAPSAGGIYRATLNPDPPLEALVRIGDGVPRVAGATFNKIGEGLSFNGRYVSFWGAWGSETRTITLYCPTSGNKTLIAYCNEQYPDGYTTTEPVNQGIFVADVLAKTTVMVARTGAGADDNFYNFLYWTYSGHPPGPGGSDEGQELPRWRSSAFSAVSSTSRGYLAAFKATKTDETLGIYLASSANPSLASHLAVADTNTLAATIDPEVNSLGSTTPLMVTSVGLERDGFRNGMLALAISMANEDASVSWAGLYLAAVPPHLAAFLGRGER